MKNLNCNSMPRQIGPPQTVRNQTPSIGDEVRKIYVSEKFKREILLHITRIIYADNAETPIMLGISGAPGEGKTFQVKHVLSNSKVEVFNFCFSEFENINAGIPIEKLVERYNEAQAEIKEKNKVACLFIDDIDVGLGKKDGYQYTVNFQHLEGGLMSFANFSEETKPRVPIILTGNNFSLLHEPLIRHGRMRHFEWTPEEKEMCLMVKYYFHQFSEDICSGIVNDINAYCDFKKIPHRNIAFYASLKTAISDDNLWIYISEKNLHYENKNITTGVQIEDLLKNTIVSKDDVITKGKFIIDMQLKSKRNHIQGGEQDGKN